MWSALVQAVGVKLVDIICHLLITTSLIFIVKRFYCAVLKRYRSAQTWRDDYPPKSLKLYFPPRPQ
ncbi:uncharacterized protein CC84DRAFT_593309 [Paraphaeosphaeria sporulosa]|uniref:Uncharacterized protein n=1 Tax=Paraphaeosphaeria sporulosa TaxID=1460663 RepID=A0A177CMY6_9PLEO|nr:uncharacterized protein CC84DRAFT_593309 [Paraphaeosphaeria sporulosa]OAG08885.1 hypothetical protein CC84DRAFT_593309 [Paraphaeosphaeria sporulosa]